MNYIFNKDPRYSKLSNNRYNIKLDKSEGLENNDNNYHKLNIYNSQNNIIKSNNIYNSNFFLQNKIKNNKDFLQNHNYFKNESVKRYQNNRQSNSIDNNFKLLYITNFKNGPNNTLLRKKPKEDKDDNKNIFKDNSKESIPTIIQIKKLIENLKIKNFNYQYKNSNSNNNSKDYHYQNYNKENNKLPDLIKRTRPTHINNINSNKSSSKNLPKSFIKNINIISTKNDKINKSNNYSKIKLKQLYYKDNDNDKELIYKNNNNSVKVEENSNDSIEKKIKNIPKRRKSKIVTNKVRNIIRENLIIDNNGNNEKIVNIRLKLNPRDSKNFFDICNNTNNNTIFMKTKKDSVNFCMSNYNNYKFDLMSLKKTFHHFENKRNKNEMLFNKNKTMFRNPLNDRKYLEENEEDEYEIENEQDDTKNYSKYYLPSSGFGLLNRQNNE